MGELLEVTLQMIQLLFMMIGMGHCVDKISEAWEDEKKQRKERKKR